jgi:hypothetical protein
MIRTALHDTMNRVNTDTQAGRCGYLTSQLLKLNLNDWKLYLIVGCVWTAWHIPYYLVFLPETDIQAIMPTLIVRPAVFLHDVAKPVIFPLDVKGEGCFLKHNIVPAYLIPIS